MIQIVASAIVPLLDLVSAWVTVVPFLLAGIGNTIVLVVSFTVYVKITPSEYLARVIGIHMAVGTAAMVLSFLLSGLLIGALGVHDTFRLETLGITCTLILGILLLRPNFVRNVWGVGYP